jgi:hypothetical protein
LAAVPTSDLFIFVGAGASVSPPSALPLFDWLRDEILHQLGLDAWELSLERRGIPVMTAGG